MKLDHTTETAPSTSYAETANKRLTAAAPHEHNHEVDEHSHEVDEVDEADEVDQVDECKDGRRRRCR